MLNVFKTLIILRLFCIFREKERDRRKHDDDRPNATTPNVATSKPVKGLSESQRDRFEDMLRTLLPDRNPIAETMVSFDYGVISF